MNQVLALWSTPRSVSTAFEWMMRQRGDFEVLHEPFQQAYYFGEDRSSERHAADPATVGLTMGSVRSSLLARAGRARTFVKDFPYCFLDVVDDEFVDAFRHTFLIRDPAKVIPSLHNHWPDFTLEETGYAGMRDMFRRVHEHTGTKPAVIDADDLLADPHETVRRYCEHVGIEFMPESLAWDTGDRREVRWYGGQWHQGLQQTSGFDRKEGGQVDPNYVRVDEDSALREAYETCRPLYDELWAQRISG
jgi:hypothetical protein